MCVSYLFKLSANARALFYYRNGTYLLFYKRTFFPRQFCVFRTHNYIFFNIYNFFRFLSNVKVKMLAEKE